FDKANISGSTPFEASAFDRKDMTIRFPLLEPYLCVRAREEPVHRKAIVRPIRLDDARQRGDAIFRPIDWAGDEQIEARLGAGQTWKMEGQHAVPEVAYRRRLRAEIGLDIDRLFCPTAVPTRGKAGWAQQLPAMGIRDIERQAAVGEALVSIHSRSSGAG